MIFRDNGSENCTYITVPALSQVCLWMPACGGEQFDLEFFCKFPHGSSNERTSTISRDASGNPISHDDLVEYKPGDMIPSWFSRWDRFHPPSSHFDKDYYVGVPTNGTTQGSDHITSPLFVGLCD